MSGPVLEYRGRDAPAARRRVVIAIVGGLIVATLAATFVLLPRMNRRSYDEPVILQCSSHLKQIGQAILLYSDENHDAMPSNFATLIPTEDLAPEVFVCYSTNDVKTAAAQPAAIRVDFAAGGHCSYVYVDGYARYSTLPANAVVAFEPFGHHDDRTNVLFGDGHVEQMKKPAADAIQQQFDAHVRPIVLPLPAN